MANLTQELNIGTDWTEVSAAASLSDNTRYILTVNGGDSGDSLFMAETDSANPAPTVAGHLVARFNGRSTEPIRYRKRASTFIWFRTTRAPATLVASETSAV